MSGEQRKKLCPSLASVVKWTALSYNFPRQFCIHIGKASPETVFGGVLFIGVILIGMKCQYYRCNKEFIPRRKDQRYCCKQCRKKASWRRTGGYQRYNWKSQGINITMQQYSEMFAAQHGRCLICNRPEKWELRVDHDHITGKVRGLLCHKCNSGLGMFNDDLGLLQTAVHYLSPN